MNKELKVMIYTAVSLLLTLLIFDNLFHLKSQSYMPQVTYSSQTIALNRLRHPNINRSSEIGKYPSVKNKKVQLVAIKNRNLMYVIASHKVIYIAHALISYQPNILTINSARGEQSIHIDGNSQSHAIHWLSIGRLGYIESPISVHNHKIRRNWIKEKFRIANTIEVSKKDAKWLQQLPKGTTVTIK